VLYAGKTSEIYSKFDRTNKELGEQFKILEKNKERLNKTLDDPKTILAFKEHGVDITKWPRLSLRGKLKRENNLLFKKSSKKLDQVNLKTTMNTEAKIRLRAITILYLLSAIADEDYQQSEAEQIILNLKEWLPDINEDDLTSIVNETKELLENGNQKKLFKSSADLINKHFDDDNKANVLKDLINIALIDDDLSQYEFTLIQRLVKTWGLADKVDVTDYVSHLKVLKEVDRLEKEEQEIKNKRKKKKQNS
jgi:uncharacterized tellurite resistance protein B-like protein